MRIACVTTASAGLWPKPRNGTCCDPVAFPARLQSAANACTFFGLVDARSPINVWTCQRSTIHELLGRRAIRETPARHACVTLCRTLFRIIMQRRKTNIYIYVHTLEEYGTALPANCCLTEVPARNRALRTRVPPLHHRAS